MAMMGSNAWNGQDQAMHPAGDEEFQQFLDMNGMGNLTENIQFDFTDFQNASPGASHLIHTTMAPTTESLDTPMTGAHHTPGLMAQPTSGQLSDAGLTGTAGIHNGSHAQHGMHPVVTTGGGSHASIATTLMPSVTPTDAISEIDAQIQYLQQQRMQQQQRQVEEQNIAFFTRQSHIVPPTPQSLELQAGNQFFHSPDPRNQHQQHPSQQSQQAAMYERYQHFKEQQDMSFTPLVSPAVTPLETQFSIDTQFTVPGAYFSPLTSPALHAQTDPNSVFDPRLTASSTSPLDMDMEMLPAAAPTASNSTSMSGDLAKKARKNNASKARKANVRQSPITKPMRKKSTTTPVMNAQVLDQLAESLEHEVLSSPVIRQQSQQQAFHPSNARLMQLGGPSSSSAGTTDSENDSVSPETLTDMPPPPLPKSRSARPSPYLHPQNHSSAPNHSMAPASAPVPAIASAALAGGFPSPATPASLMKLSSPKQKSHKSSPAVTASKRDGTASGSNSVGGGATTSVGVANEHIENFELPESLSMDFQKTHVSTSSVHNTPSIETTASPSLDPIASGRAFQPLPSPSITKLGGGTRSATQSPQILPGGQSSSTPLLAANSSRKTPQMLPRGSSSKKRPSISSVQVSPALRPKISPSIKPLLPGGVSSVEDQASRLLATKSNYQNILEGNTVPGVSYPSELSTNLTSKRTSHKIAEQGRRNRINSALQEIATLLPTPPPKETKAGEAAAAAGDDEEGGDGKKDGKSGSGGAAGANNNAPNSKASTVEMAIEYIKQLKKEVADLTKRAEDAESKLQLKVEETS